jgi:putative heme-binding domain-containing protein
MDVRAMAAPTDSQENAKASWSAAGTGSTTPLSAQESLDVLRVLAVAFARLGGPSDAERSEWLKVLEPKFKGGATGPASKEASHRLTALLKRELCRTLVYLRSPQIIAETTALLRNAASSEDLLFYPFILRYLKDGWTLEARRVCFEALNRAEKLNGASTYFKAISDTRSELAAALSPEEAATLAAVVHPPKPAALSAHALPGHTFRNWKLEDFEGKLDAVAKGRSHAGAKAALVSTQCVFCHRVIADASLPAGAFGPDLTQVSSRFSRRDLLMHILEPSKFVDEKFRFLTVTKTDGASSTGSLEREDDERVVLRPNPLAPDTVEIGKAMIRERKVSEVSPMPPGLLNALKLEQILDLLAWFEAQGNPSHAAFAK